jgi:hypothetical protein
MSFRTTQRTRTDLQNAKIIPLAGLEEVDSIGTTPNEIPKNF